MRRERYLEKLEVFEEELNFIESHQICDDVTERGFFIRYRSVLKCTGGACTFRYVVEVVYR